MPRCILVRQSNIDKETADSQQEVIKRKQTDIISSNTIDFVKNKTLEIQHY